MKFLVLAIVMLVLAACGASDCTPYVKGTKTDREVYIYNNQDLHIGAIVGARCKFY